MAWLAMAAPYLQTAGTVLTAGAALKTALDKPKMPGAKAMPMPDDDAILQARRRQAAEIQSRSGRASTILSATGEKLGG